MNLPKSLLAIAMLFSAAAWAQSDCNPSAPGSVQLVDRGLIKSVTGTLAAFDPCHRSVQLDTPSFFARQRGEKPPVIIIAHGGAGLAGYEREFARWMNQQGFATLLFDAFEMNGLPSRSDLVMFQMTNASRQRMIYKATWGAYQWVLKQPKLDTSRIFIQGLSNGGSVSINMAAAVDPAHVKGVIAEGAPAAGIGFPHQVNVPLLMIYGTLDNYGGVSADDYMHLRGQACYVNEHDPTVPAGVAQTCNLTYPSSANMPTPLAWYEKVKSQGADVRWEMVEGGGHGALFGDFSSSMRRLGPGRNFYIALGASADARKRLQKTVLDFIESRL